ncbi:MAG: hypothetical protein AB7G08_26420 [Hyphomicrobiaceae bacterium]
MAKKLPADLAEAERLLKSSTDAFEAETRRVLKAASGRTIVDLPDWYMDQQRELAKIERHVAALSQATEAARATAQHKVNLARVAARHAALDVLEPILAALERADGIAGGHYANPLRRQVDSLNAALAEFE